MALLSAAAGWLWQLQPSRTAAESLVIVTLDTTRADRLSAYGNMDVVMPHLDRLAAEGVVFDRATSVGALTLPAHTSLFTGLLPPAHGVRENASPPLDEAHVTLAEVLAARGFRTAAFVGSVVLNADRGLAQGFEHYGAVDPSAGNTERWQRRADEVIDEAAAWLEAAPRGRFFLWVHLFDPHRPYDPPAPFRSMHDPYVGEILFADSQIGRLLEALARRESLERTVVVVAGDHGESLGEHGERDHGIFVYESVLRVPLIVRAPGLAPARVGDVVQLTDVMPTVLELLGMTAPAMHGRSLAPLMRGEVEAPGRPAYAESLYPQRFGWSPLYAMRDGRYKFIDAPRPELYDLERDPFEQDNVFERHPDVAADLLHRLRRLEHDSSSRKGGRARGVPQETHRQLAALGYIGHSMGVNKERREGLPDPKDCIQSYNAQVKAADAGTVEPQVGCR